MFSRLTIYFSQFDDGSYGVKNITIIFCIWVVITCIEYI